MKMKAFLACAVGIAGLAWGFRAIADGHGASGHHADAGQEIYKRANCVGCHKWHGGGGGGYGGAALSLRKTQLDREQIVQTVTCGRPGTGMPYFVRNVYSDDQGSPHPCNGMAMKDLADADMKVAEAGTLLRPEEVDEVAKYLLTKLKGKGDPTGPECIAFFGDASRACESYKKGGKHEMPAPSTTN